MIVGSVSENKDLEKRISITPDIAKKYGWKSKSDFKQSVLKTYNDYLDNL